MSIEYHIIVRSCRQMMLQFTIHPTVGIGWIRIRDHPVPIDHTHSYIYIHIICQKPSKSLLNALNPGKIALDPHQSPYLVVQIRSFSPRCCGLACAHDHLLHSGLAILVALHEPGDAASRIGSTYWNSRFAKEKNQSWNEEILSKPKLQADALNQFCPYFLTWFLPVISTNDFLPIIFTHCFLP